MDAGRVGPNGETEGLVGQDGGWAEWAEWGRVGQGGVWGGGPGGGVASRVGRLVGWYGQVAVNIYTA